jgi:hypothetical protein
VNLVTMSQDTNLQAIIDECVPLIRQFPAERYAISIGGSRGKGTSDGRSDVDFRLFWDQPAPGWPDQVAAFASFREAMVQWRAKGTEIDGCWIRKIADIDGWLDQWIEGKIIPQDIVWTVWGYYLLPDIYHQQVVEDPFGVIAQWKERLKTYPAKLKKALLDKHLGSLRYWRNDYHYASKVQRGDVIFLAGLSARLVHDIMQVLFALNEVYFVGDGSNLEFARHFKHQPPQLAERVREALYPWPGEDVYVRQRAMLVELIDEVERLAESVGKPNQEA